jgi:general secretion pathway protein K
MKGIQSNGGSATILMMLIASVIVTVGIGFNWLVREHIRASEGLKNKAEAILQARSAFDTVIYLILNGQKQRREIVVIGGTDITKLETLPLDGKPIQLSEDLEVRIQDSNGMITVNPLKSGPMSRLIRNAANLEQATDLMNCMLDWTDTDDFTRINGAEAFKYSGQGVPYTPRNFAIQYMDEIGFVKGFESGLYEKIQPYLTMLPSTGFNPNTASDMILMSYLDINEKSLAVLKEFMAFKPIASDMELFAMTGRKLGIDEGSHFRPSPYLDITVTAGAPRGIYAIRAGLNTFQNVFSPYSIEYWREE